MTRSLIAVLTLMVTLSLQAATEVIPLKFRMAEDVLPIAESVVGDQGKINAYGNQLIINAPASVINELRDVLAQLDNEPRQLLISIDSQNSATSGASGYSVDGSARAGNVEVQTGRGERNGRDQVRIIRHSTTSEGGGIQQVQATEGYPALIQVGQSVPITTSGHDGYGQIYQQTQFRDVTRGFYATATIHGDQVQLTISSHQDRMSSSRPGAIDVQETNTSVRGKLGEWISLGGIDESASSSQSGTLRRYSTQGRQDLSLRLKVDTLD
ncbi:secretin N-terminal domain-containing protein [Stutzerimonas zhaodongensis]|uniref:secretin N-terminal domain-containing protein n=1 Tax=Stutzerimonas zhaodongensis TaxID=1176257 RepID=UPI002107BC7E|nr:secretin N-terminal domain-containing protein [Stutzerimonas zhaodongensis]MCQ2029960.1 secretin [Stutzerimonas zhaodongensis]